MGRQDLSLPSSFWHSGSMRWLSGASPFLGRGTNWGLNATVRPTSRVQAQLNANASRLTDPRARHAEVFDVKVLRARTDVQFTDRRLRQHIAFFIDNG